MALSYEKRCAQADASFLAGGDIHALLMSRSDALDALIVDTLQLSPDFPCCVIATGGYGRREMFPHSDIDLLFLHPQQGGAESEHVFNALLYALWDRGFSVGHAQRSVEETLALARADIAILTPLIDARFLTGDPSLFSRLMEGLKDHLTRGGGTFIEAKLAERDARHLRFGDSRYVLEPNVKEGKGALRDLQTLWWLARAAYSVNDIKELVDSKLLTREDYHAFDQARRFLWRVRAHLHLLENRPQERLSFDRQPEIARRMGYDQADSMQATLRFMRRYFAMTRLVGQATRIMCALLEEEGKRAPKHRLGWFAPPAWQLGHFKLIGDRLTPRTDLAFERRPELMIELFRLSQQYGTDIHPRALQDIARHRQRIDRSVRSDATGNAAFLAILLAEHAAETTLRRMSDAGVLGRFIPAFGRVAGQMQFNRYHVYTVDEHTLMAIGILHALENGDLAAELPDLSTLVRPLPLRRALYVALFCHDLAKGQPGDHALSGVKIARHLAKRLDLEAAEIETAGWLVEHHLLFSATAFKRDLDDPKTVDDFVAIIQTTERLRLLLALTVADIRAVGPAVWTPWKSALLVDLYQRAKRLIEGDAGHIASSHINRLDGWAGGARETAKQLLSTPLTDQEIRLSVSHDTARRVTDLVLCAQDEPGLFSTFAGAISLAGANIISARIVTLADGTAIDHFQIQDKAGEPFNDPRRLAKLRDWIHRLRSGEPFISGASIPRRIPPHVAINHDASGLHTVIEVSGLDRPGFLYHVTHALAEQEVSIVSAHISTYGARVADVFYVKDAFGMKIRHPDKLQAITAAIEAL